MSDTKTLKQKMDSLIEENKIAKMERMRERVLSKLDISFAALVTLSTFVIGLIVNQHDFLLTNTWLLFLLIGVGISIIVSFADGFRGMINNSIENRMLAWSLLFSSSVYYLASPAMPFTHPSSIHGLTISILIYSAAIGFVIGLIQTIVAWRFTLFAEAKLATRAR